MTKEEKNEMAKKVFALFVDKYGKLYNNLDSSIVMNYIRREIDERDNITYPDAVAIVNGAYKRITPKEMSINDLLANLFNFFGHDDVQKDTNDDKMEDANKTKNDKPVCKCNAENSKAKSKYVSDTNDLKTVKYLLPGVQKNNITIDIIGDEIRISLNDIVVETPFVNPDFKDVILVDENMDLDNMKAKLELGVLTLTIPKKVKIEEKRTIKIC
jgi:HSP20 family molecular chaperone IbpA